MPSVGAEGLSPFAPSAGFLRRRLFLERLFRGLLLAAAALSVLITLAIVAVLVRESLPFLRQVGLSAVLLDTVWTPLFAEPRYGIWALVAGTLTTTSIALALALPTGLALALYLSEYAPPRLREAAKPVLELLAAVPTVVYGYFALLVVTPLLQRLIPGLPPFNMLAAGLVLGVMILPYAVSLSEDALRAVPRELREAAYALGFTRLQTGLRVMLPAASSGIISAFLLALARAMGETMVVTLAAGQNPRFTFDPLEGAATMTAYIVQVSFGDVPHGSLAYRSLFLVALGLFLCTFAVNLAGTLLSRKRPGREV